MVKEWFDTEERKAIKARQLNRREKEMQSLRKEIKTLQEVQGGNGRGKRGEQILTATLCDQLCRLRKAEQARKERRSKRAKRALFI